MKDKTSQFEEKIPVRMRGEPLLDWYRFSLRDLRPIWWCVTRLSPAPRARPPPTSSSNARLGMGPLKGRCHSLLLFWFNDSLATVATFWNMGQLLSSVWDLHLYAVLVVAELLPWPTTWLNRGLKSFCQHPECPQLSPYIIYRFIPKFETRIASSRPM